MTASEKKIAIIIWFADGYLGQTINNNREWVDQKLRDTYPELGYEANWSSELTLILNELINEGYIETTFLGNSFDLSAGEIMQNYLYKVSLNGRAYAKMLLKKKEIFRYIKRSGVVENGLTPIEMTDKVLQWFCMDINEIVEENFEDSRDRIGRRFISEMQVGVAVINHFRQNGFKELNSSEFTWFFPLIMDKLVKDNFITHHENKTYSQNMEGVIFSKRGGYRNQILENTRAERRIQEYQNLTKILAFGVATPFLWYLQDLIKLYLNRWMDLYKISVFGLVCGCLGAGLWYILPLINRRKRVMP